MPRFAQFRQLFHAFRSPSTADNERERALAWLIMTTNAAGWMFFAYNYYIFQRPAIARDVLELCPNALFFNYANPMSVICRAVRKATAAEMVGLCIGTWDTVHYLARTLGVPFEALSYNAAGINHLTWFSEVRVNGQDAMPALRQHAEKVLASVRAAQEAQRLHGTPLPHNDSAFDSSLGFPFSWQCLLWFGAFPSPEDRHVTEFFPQFFRSGGYYGKTLGVNEFAFERTIEFGDRIYGDRGASRYPLQPPDDVLRQPAQPGPGPQPALRRGD
jgi:alpha-galactosidase